MWLALGSGGVILLLHWNFEEVQGHPNCAVSGIQLPSKGPRTMKTPEQSMKSSYKSLDCLF